MQLWLIFGDFHIPWHSFKKIQLACEVARDQGATHILINGDFLDAYNLSAHGPKDPQVRKNLDDEFQAALDVLSWMRSFFGYGVEIIFSAGNHEHRLDRFIMKNCPAFYNHLTIEKMLQLDNFKITYNPYNQPYIITQKLKVQHSPPSYSQNAARTSLIKKMDVDHVFNCTHRTDTAVVTGASGTDYQVICNGWFGKLDIIRKNQSEMPENRRVYMFTKNHESWNCSATFAHVYRNKHSLQNMLIKEDEKGRVFTSFGGHYYEL